MTTSSERRDRALSWLAGACAIVGVVGSLGIVAAEMYVRWTLNQNFTFLGGNALEALIVASFGMLFGLVYLKKTRN